MSTLAVLELAAAIADGPNPALELALAVAADSPLPGEVLELDATSTDLSTAVRPRGTRQIVLPFKVTIGGTEFPYWQRLPGMTVTESIEGPTFSWDMPRRGTNTSAFGEPLGVPTAFLGPPPGLAAINIDARVYHSTAGIQTIRLVTNGIAENSSAKASGGGDTRTINGTGARGRYKSALATYTLAPGHGRARHDVARQILLAADVPTGSIAFGIGGRRCYKGAQIVDQTAVDFIGQYLKPGMVQVSENRSGQLALVPLAPTGSESPQWTFTEQDLLRTSDLSESCAADGPTCVRVTGSKQITREDEGRRTIVRVVETYGYDYPASAAFSQGGGGTLTAVTPSVYDPLVLRLQSRVTYEQEYLGDTLVSERVTTEGFYNPSTYRYTLDITGAITGYQSAVYIFDADAVADDDSLAYRFVESRFGMLSQTTTRYLYDSRGFLTEQITETSRYQTRYTALKTRTVASDPWETEDFYSSVKVLGTGEGVAENEGFVGPYVALPPAAFAGVGLTTSMSGPTYPATWAGATNDCVDRSTLTYNVSDDGYVLKESTEEETYRARAGQLYLYAGGVEAADQTWLLRSSGTIETSYFGGTEGNHTIVSVTTDANGKAQTEISYAQGHLPAAERSMDMIDPDWATDFSAEDLAYAKAASRFEQQPMKIRLCSDSLASVRPEYEEKVSDEWAEDTEELYAIGEYTIRAGCVLEVSFDLPFNPLVRPATVVHLSCPTIPLEYDVWVTSVAHSEGERETTTRVSGEVWML